MHAARRTGYSPRPAPATAVPPVVVMRVDRGHRRPQRPPAAELQLSVMLKQGVVVATSVGIVVVLAITATLVRSSLHVVPRMALPGGRELLLRTPDASVISEATAIRIVSGMYSVPPRDRVTALYGLYSEGIN